MDDREKLAKLLEEAEYKFCVERDPVIPFSHIIADHLIANGVTVQRWIPVAERLPGMMQPVIVCRANGKVEAGCLDVNGWWKVYGTRTKRVTHWMPLPKPPKEDK